MGASASSIARVSPIAPTGAQHAPRTRMSLRETDLIHTPQRPPPTTELCQYTPHGFATDIPLHIAWSHAAVACTASVTAIAPTRISGDRTDTRQPTAPARVSSTAPTTVSPTA